MATDVRGVNVVNKKMELDGEREFKVSGGWVIDNGVESWRLESEERSALFDLLLNPPKPIHLKYPDGLVEFTNDELFLSAEKVTFVLGALTNLIHSVVNKGTSLGLTREDAAKYRMTSPILLYFSIKKSGILTSQ